MDPRRTAKVLALMDPADANKLCFDAGLEPGGNSVSTGHSFSSTDVYNSIKRIIAFSDIVRKNKAVKQVLETSVDSASKLAFEVLLAGGDVPEILHQLANLRIQRAGLAGNKFGTENARRLYEETIGDILEDHVEYPLHPDSPAPVVLDNAQASQQESTTLDEVSCDVLSVLHEPAIVTIAVLQFSQTKSWFKTALLDSPELQHERDALTNAGYCSVLESGAKIFVAPELFEGVVEYLRFHDWTGKLKSSHVIVSSEIECKVMDVLEAARVSATKQERGTSKLKDRSELNIDPASLPHSHASSKQVESPPDVFFVVARTFVHIPIASSMYSTPSIHATTV